MSPAGPRRSAAATCSPDLDANTDVLQDRIDDGHRKPIIVVGQTLGQACDQVDVGIFELPHLDEPPQQIPADLVLASVEL